MSGSKKNRGLGIKTGIFRIDCLSEGQKRSLLGTGFCEPRPDLMGAVGAENQGQDFDSETRSEPSFRGDSLYAASEQLREMGYDENSI